MAGFLKLVLGCILLVAVIGCVQAQKRDDWRSAARASARDDDWRSAARASARDDDWRSARDIARSDSRAARTAAMLFRAFARYDCLDRVCSKEYSPVCDNEGRLYKNDCEWNIRRCQSEQMGKIITLQKPYTSGGEVTCLKVMRRSAFEEARMNCGWECADVWEPVCDQHGKEYNNLCYFQRQKCVNNSLQMIYPKPEEGGAICSAGQ